MKFGQFIEYNIRNSLLKDSYTKCVRETSPKYFSKKSKLTISLDQHILKGANYFLLIRI